MNHTFIALIESIFLSRKPSVFFRKTFFIPREPLLSLVNQTLFLENQFVIRRKPIVMEVQAM